MRKLPLESEAIRNPQRQPPRGLRCRSPRSQRSVLRTWTLLCPVQMQKFGGLLLVFIFLQRLPHYLQAGINPCQNPPSLLRPWAFGLQRTPDRPSQTICRPSSRKRYARAFQRAFNNRSRTTTCPLGIHSFIVTILTLLFQQTTLHH